MRKDFARSSRRNVANSFAEIAVDFHSRAAIWPLTLGPLGYSGARGTCPMRYRKTSPRLDRAPSPGRVGHPGKRPRGRPFTPPPPRRSHDIPRVIPRVESERSARTYVPSCRLIFRLKSHIRQTPRAPRDRSLRETRLP